MKNYTLNREDSKKFIRYYTEYYSTLKIYYGSGKSYPIPHTEENEKKVLEQMRQQVLQSDDYIKEHEKRFSKAKTRLLVTVAVNLLPSACLLTGIALVPSLTIIIMGAITLCMGRRVLMMIDSQAKIRDIKKNKMFLENEEKLNKRIQVNQNILTGMNKKTIQTDVNPI